MSHTPFLHLLRAHGADRSERPALREKVRGVWRELSWADTLRHAERLTRAFERLGIGVGKGVLVVGEPRARLLFSIVAAQALGAHVTIIGSEDAALSAAAWGIDYRLAVVQNEELVPALRAPSGASALERVVVLHTGAAFDATDPLLVSYDALLSEADDVAALDVERRLRAEGALIEVLQRAGERVERVRLHDEHRLASAGDSVRAMGLAHDDQYVVPARLAWPAFWPILLEWLSAGFCLNSAEQRDSHLQDRREIGPTYLNGTAASYEETWIAAQASLGHAGSINRRAVDWAFRVASDGSRSPWRRLQAVLANALVLRPLRERLGLSRVRVAALSGEPLDPQLERILAALNVVPRSRPGTPTAAPALPPSAAYLNEAFVFVQGSPERRAS